MRAKAEMSIIAREVRIWVRSSSGRSAIGHFSGGEALVGGSGGSMRRVAKELIRLEEDGC